MRAILLKVTFWSLMTAGLASPARAAGDGAPAISAFSGFMEIDLQSLRRGEILIQRGSVPDSSQGMFVQSCYWAGAPPAKVAAIIQAPPAPSTGTVIGTLSAPPKPGDFHALTFSSEKALDRWILDATVATTPQKHALQLSREEAGVLEKCAAGAPVDKAARATALAECWRSLLLGHAVAFWKSGLSGVPPYDVDGKPLTAAGEIDSMLKWDAKLHTRYEAVLGAILRNPAESALKPSAYFTESEVNGHTNLALGVSIESHDGENILLGDCTYYTSESYFFEINLNFVMPAAGGSVVWQGDYVSVPFRPYLAGIDRKTAALLMASQIKRSIHAVQAAAGK